MKFQLTYLTLAISLSLVSCLPPAPSVNPKPSSTPSPMISSIPNKETTPSPSPINSPIPSSSSTTIPTTQSPNTEPVNSTASAKVASIKFADNTNRFLNRQNEERQLNIVLRDADGNVVTQDNLQLEFLSSRERDISIDSTGKIKAIVGLGYSKITVRLSGTNIEHSINFDITDPSFFSSSNSLIVQQPVAEAEMPIVIPTITDLSISNGVPGQTLVINGTNFSTIIAENTVKFGTTVATVTSVTPTSITIKIPSLTVGETTITINTNNQESTSQKFTIDPLINFVINGETALDQSGYSVSGAGDVNGDGKDDIIIGAIQGESNGKGRSYVIYGGSVTGSVLNLTDITNGDGSKGFVLNGEAANDFSGRSVSAAGDINSDGKDDIIIGGSDADPNGLNKSGRSYVIYGGTVTGPVLNLSTITAP